MHNIAITTVNSDAALTLCQDIRRQVFVIGQNVPIHEEIDGLDDSAEHYLLYFDTEPAGTARVRYSDECALIERVAVLDQHQGKGLGRQLIQHIIADISDNTAITKATLGSQVHAIPFYEKLGFTVYGPEYMDANIPHKKMSLDLSFVKN